MWRCFQMRWMKPILYGYCGNQFLHRVCDCPPKTCETFYVFFPQLIMTVSFLETTLYIVFLKESLGRSLPFFLAPVKPKELERWVQCRPRSNNKRVNLCGTHGRKWRAYIYMSVTYMRMTYKGDVPLVRKDLQKGVWSLLFCFCFLPRSCLFLDVLNGYTITSPYQGGDMQKGCVERTTHQVPRETMSEDGNDVSSNMKVIDHVLK